MSMACACVFLQLDKDLRVPSAICQAAVHALAAKRLIDQLLGRESSIEIEDRKESRPISRVLSWAIIPLGRPSPCASSGLPGSTRRSGAAVLPPRLPYLALLQVGFAVAVDVATNAVRSYRTISPLPALLPALRRFAFCCTFRGLAPPRRYLAPRPAEPGLSSATQELPVKQRLPGRLSSSHDTVSSPTLQRNRSRRRCRTGRHAPGAAPCRRQTPAARR